MEKDYIEFMSKMLDKGHAGLVPDGEISCNKSQGEYGTYLTSTVPSEKTRPIRVVFDSSAEYQGKSLNSELLTGPNLRKTPLGVIVRLRREE